jgi:hypothetical protein
MYAFMMRTGGGLLLVFARMVTDIILLSHLGSLVKIMFHNVCRVNGCEKTEKDTCPLKQTGIRINFLLEAMILSEASMKVEYQGWSQPLSFIVSVQPISRKKLHCKFLVGYGRSLFCTAS